MTKKKSQPATSPAVLPPAAAHQALSPPGSPQTSLPLDGLAPHADAAIGNVVVIPKCPECEAAGIPQKPFKSTAELGRHRSSVHNIPGNSPTAKALRRKKEGLIINGHREGSGTTLTVPPAPGKATQPGDDAQYAYGLTIGHALGRVQGFLETLAEGHGLPPRDFTREIARLLLREAGR
jgi:hypothetical protein